MKKIISTIFLMCATCTAIAHADEASYFGYGDLQSMGDYPMVGIGMRGQKNIHGFDISANACPLKLPQSLNIYHLRGLYLIYPAQTGFYLGAGFGLLKEANLTKTICGSVEAAMGWQSGMGKNAKVFVELHGIAPSHKWEFSDSKTVIKIWPGLTIGCGF